MSWYLVACSEKGNVNELCCGDCDKIASRMMETFDYAGYKWVDYVDGETEMTYTLERR